MPTLMEDLGMKRGEGLVCAYLPDAPDILHTDEGGSGILYSTQGRVAIDYILYNEKPVKWWVFKNVARDLGYNFPEPIWHGPVEDFRLQCLPDVPKPAGTKLAVRQYHCGPWVTLTTEDLLTYE